MEFVLITLKLLKHSFYLLKMLISGAQVPIDIEDLKSHASYSGTNKTLYCFI